MAGQVGWKSETTWGTGVTPDKFVPVLKSTLAIDQGFLRPAGIRAGRRTRAVGKPGAFTATGQLQMELPNVTVATLLKHMFGAVNTTGAGPYTHVLTPGPALGQSLTIQTGINDAADTVRPFTAVGAKVTGWELSCRVGEYAQLSADWNAKDVTTGTALAAASYAATIDPFTFIEGSVSLGGTAVASARYVTLRANKGLKVDRHVLGSRFTREQLEQDKWEFTGQIECDFEDLTAFNHALAADELDLAILFDNGTDSLSIAANVQLIGDAPSLDTPGLQAQTLNFEVGSDTSDAVAITATLINSDASAT